MCGIAGIVNFQNLDIQKVKNSLRHRGPHEQSSICVNNTTLVHTRLAIQDIQHGQQPMQLGALTIVLNGEIYNHQELRKEHNLKCQTQSDTETLLHLFEKYGIDCLKELDGMFAFAIYDSSTNILWIARDRAGKKPLYIYHKDNSIIFASELNTISQIVRPDINHHAIFDYLRLGCCFQSETPYQNITELPAGNVMKIDTVSLNMTLSTWWDIEEYYLRTCNDDLQTSIAKTDSLLKASIKRRVESSDLEVGTFLSGGIDSGLVTAIASEFKNRLKTFTVSFDGEFNEAPLAMLVANQYQTDHTEIRISFDNLQNHIEKILLNYGEPFFDSSAIPSFYISQAAKQHLTVILNGDGADELFAGYRRYVPFSHYNFFRKNKLRQGLSRAILSAMPQAHHKLSHWNFLRRLMTLSSENNLNCYYSATTDIFEGFLDQIKTGDSALSKTHLAHYFDHVMSLPLSPLKKILLLDFKILLFGDLLVKMDIATMAHSLEARSPFLAKELLEYAPTLNDNFKIKHGQTKYLLRRLAKKYLPQTICQQPKRGFEVPLNKWVNIQLKDLIWSSLSGTPCCTRYVDNHFLNQLLENKLSLSAEKRSKIIWNLFTLEVWLRNHNKPFVV